MANHPISDTVLLVESGGFEAKADELLTANERRGLQLVLAENPFCGRPSVLLPEMMELVWAGCRVVYLVRSDATKVYLVDIESQATPSTALGAHEQTAVRKTLEAMAPTLGVAVAKEGAKWLWNLLKHHL